MKEIVMPKLSDTMTEGRLVAWRKSVGETVKRGDVIAEVETDKANMELEAFSNGVLLETRIQPGEVAAVGTVIGVIGAPGEKAAGAPKGEEAPPREEPPKRAEAAPPAPAPPSAGEGKKEEAPSVKPAEKPTGEPVRTEAAPEGIPAPEATQAPFGPEKAGKEQEKPPAPAEEKPAERGGEAPSEPVPEPQRPAGPAAVPERHEERAAPVVRRRARELGIDLSTVKGSGPEGRILLQDLENLAAGAPAAPRAPSGSGGAAPAPAEEQKLSRFRAAIARTVIESWQQIPQFSATVEIVMDPVTMLRQDLKGAGEEISVNDVVVKAVALALAKFPLANGSFAGESLRLHQEINIGIVVGLPDALFIPVITGCGERSLTEIARESRRLVERARNGQLTEAEMSGGTFTISNLGMFGITRFNALIFPPQAAVLAVGAAIERPLPKGGAGTEPARVMEVTLSADHRILDGVYVAHFLKEVKEILEHPARLLL